MTGIPSWARVGAQVVCAMDIWSNRDMCGWPVPEPGSIYTIARVAPYSANEWAGPLISLREINGEPYGYELYAFRPLVSKPTEAELEARQKQFDTWLNPTPKDAVRLLDEALDGVAGRWSSRDIETSKQELIALWAEVHK